MIDNMNGFIVLSDADEAEIVGGGPVEYVIKLIVGECVAHWADFTRGVADGFKAGAT
jgi:hypothetical protein